MIVWFIVEFFIVFVGIIGNFVVCFVIIKYCDFNIVVINMYIRNVVIGDLVMFFMFILLGIVRE